MKYSIKKQPAECLQHCDGPNRNGSYGDRVMAKRPLPSPEVLRQLLRYEPDTGKLFWQVRAVSWFANGAYAASWNTKYAGKEAFTAKDRDGYYAGSVLGRIIRAHRVIFAIVNGHWPKHQVDHVNGIRSDNTSKNLRAATCSENARNKTACASNSSGFKGVHFCKDTGRWRAVLRINGRTKYLGRFYSAEEAARIYADAAERYHGDFSNTCLSRSPRPAGNPVQCPKCGAIASYQEVM